MREELGSGWPFCAYGVVHYYAAFLVYCEAKTQDQTTAERRHAKSRQDPFCSFFRQLCQEIVERHLLGLCQTIPHEGQGKRVLQQQETDTNHMERPVGPGHQTDHRLVQDLCLLHCVQSC